MKKITTYSHNTKMKRLLTGLLFLAALISAQAQPATSRSRIGESVTSPDGAITVTCMGKKQNYNWNDKATHDEAINSPKSVNFHPDGTRFYVNSLEGCKTVVYDARTLERIKVIEHHFEANKKGVTWSEPSGFYKFTHYEGGENRAFDGKPVESAFSHDGRYLWVPYYRRSFDINAQDPSAIAIIDTRTDSIVRMMETGPLPKMVACSHNGKYIAVTHGGDNTVGIIDISSPDMAKWHHLPPVVVEHQLQLNFSLSSSVNRDTNSGLTLRGTVFTPDDKYLLVGMMSGGAIAVIDVAKGEYLGRINSAGNVRHLIIKDKYLYASNNSAGIVRRVLIDKVIDGIAHREGKNINVGQWETCQVGTGARTIEASPSGRWVFAACNTVSKLFVVDTRTMKVAASIAVDSYPVGLDISVDGSLVAVTSQGIKGSGGNAVNLYKIEYTDKAEAEAGAKLMAEREKRLAEADTTAQKAAADTAGGEDGSGIFAWVKTHPWLTGLIAAAVVAVLVLLLRRRKRK